MGSVDRSGRITHLEEHSEVIDWSGENKNSDSHPRDITGNEDGTQFEIFPELIGERETHPQVTDRSGSNDHFDIKPEIIEANRSMHASEISPEVVDRNGSSKLSETYAAVGDSNYSSNHMEMHLPTPINESDLVVPITGLRSSSSSSSASLSEDPFQVDTERVENYTPSTPRFYMDTQTSLKGKQFPDLTSPSQVSQSSHEWMVNDIPPTQSPPLQVMDRSGEYDPLRLPSSIFERKSSIPRDWSAASGDSLFSIHIGNNSFSREQVVTLEGDQLKSGELKSEEFITFSPVPPTPEVGTDSVRVEPEKWAATRGSVGSIKDVIQETKVRQNQGKATVRWNPSNISNHSNGSGNSGRSFAFPIKNKTKKKKRYCACVPFFCCTKKCRRNMCAWPSCYCSNCSCKLCYFPWPSCYSSNCSRAFCYCWNCYPKRWCYHFSTILTEGIKNPSGKAVYHEKQQEETLATEVTSKSFSCCWFPSFSCRPPSCHCGRCFYCCSCYRCVRCFSCSSCCHCGRCLRCSNCCHCGGYFRCSSCCR